MAPPAPAPLRPCSLLTLRMIENVAANREGAPRMQVLIEQCGEL